MTISIRTRRDVIVVDPERFLAAARAAAGGAVTDVHDAVHALLDRDGDLVPGIDAAGPGRGAGAPGAVIEDRADGISPAGRVQQIVLDEPTPLQDYGCFLPADPFALPPGTRSGEV
jgi:hypothetical protein